MDEASEESLREVAEDLNALATGLLRYLLSDRQNVNLTTASALSRLEQEGPIRLTALAAAEGLAQPSTTALVQRLEEQGLASRVTHPQDGRVRLVAITDAGRALLAERRHAQCARTAVLMTALSEQDMRALGDAMRTALPIVQRMIQAARRSGDPGDGPPS
ncbi:MarR family transcriptional regulator [Streptomyces sp900105755]|uniref:MarR family transcriptional regulator n=1 Tax=Streptomyces sp. 900105755 TaxID=3154389 RepID=A0ABV1TX50_9ACTN